METLVKVSLVVLVLVVSATFGAGITKLMWHLCNMTAWCGLELPWGPAFFLSLMVCSGRSGGSSG